MKVTVIGNSVALRVRPPAKYPENKNYTYLLREKFDDKISIYNKAIGASTVINWNEMSEQVINEFPDIFIIQLGVVDATVREVPLWFYRLSTRKNDTIFSKGFKAIYRGPISKIRSVLAKVRGGRSWVSSKRFKKEYGRLIEVILKETNASIISLPINLAGKRVEKQLPGSRKKHKKYNEIIRLLSEKYDQDFIDLSDLSSEKHYPDGVHFNAAGHEVVAERLAALINEKKSDIIGN